MGITMQTYGRLFIPEERREAFLADARVVAEQGRRLIAVYGNAALREKVFRF